MWLPGSSFCSGSPCVTGPYQNWRETKRDFWNRETYKESVLRWPLSYCPIVHPRVGGTVLCEPDHNHKRSSAPGTVFFLEVEVDARGEVSRRSAGSEARETVPIFDLRFCRCKRTHPSAKIQPWRIVRRSQPTIYVPSAGAPPTVITPFHSPRDRITCRGAKAYRKLDDRSGASDFNPAVRRWEGAAFENE
jgi:hypothetical protein